MQNNYQQLLAPVVPFPISHTMIRVAVCLRSAPSWSSARMLRLPLNFASEAFSDLVENFPREHASERFPVVLGWNRLPSTASYFFFFLFFFE